MFTCFSVSFAEYGLEADNFGKGDEMDGLFPDGYCTCNLSIRNHLADATVSATKLLGSLLGG